MRSCFCKLSLKGQLSESCCHPLVAAPGPLCVLGLREVNLEGTRPVRPGATGVKAPRSVATIGTRRALVIVSWTTIGVSPEDAAASSQVGSPARCCPGVLQAGAGGAASLKLVCSPVVLKLSPCPPMYAWSVNQARASAIDKPVFGSFTWTFEISAVLMRSMLV